MSSLNFFWESLPFLIKVSRRDSSSPNLSYSSPKSVMWSTPLSILAQFLRTNQPIEILTSFLSILSILAKSFIASSFFSLSSFKILLSGRPIFAYFLPFSVKENFSSTSFSTSIISFEAREPAALITDLMFKPVLSAISSGLASSFFSNSLSNFFS